MLAGVIGGRLVDGDRDVAQPLGERAVADKRDRALEVDRLVMADVRLRARRENRLGQLVDSRRPAGSGMPDTAPVPGSPSSPTR